MDWDIPGHTRLTDTSQTIDIVQWAHDLDLLEEKNRWKSLAHVASKLIEPYQRESFRGTERLPNPLRLSPSQRAFFLFAMLKKDGLFLIPFMSRFDSRTIGRKLSVQIYMESWKALADQMELRSLQKQLSELNASLDKHSSAELRVKAKLEPLTDITLLNRTNPWEYEYTPTKDFSRFKNCGYWSADQNGVIAVQELDRFLEEDFFKAANLTYNGKNEPEPKAERIDHWILESYSKLVGGLGLVRIDEICLLSGFLALALDHSSLDIAKVRQRIFSLNKRDRLRYSLSVDMNGNPAYLKIEKGTLTMRLTEH